MLQAFRCNASLAESRQTQLLSSLSIPGTQPVYNYDAVFTAFEGTGLMQQVFVSTEQRVSNCFQVMMHATSTRVLE